MPDENPALCSSNRMGVYKGPDLMPSAPSTLTAIRVKSALLPPRAGQQLSRRMCVCVCTQVYVRAHSVHVCEYLK